MSHKTNTSKTASTVVSVQLTQSDAIGAKGQALSNTRIYIIDALGAPTGAILESGVAGSVPTSGGGGSPGVVPLWTTATALDAGAQVRATVAVGGFIVGEYISSNSSRTTGVTFDVIEAAFFTSVPEDTTVLKKSEVVNVLTSTAVDVPLSAAQGKSLQDTKAPLASPALTGTPSAPTAGVGTNTTQIATTAFVQAEIAQGAIVRDWQATYAYDANEIVRATATVGTIDAGDIIRSNSARTSGAAFDVTEAANWTNLGADLVRSVSGKTGAVVLVKTDVGLSNVDNTSDVEKPLSVAAFRATYSDNLCFNGGADRGSLDGWMAESGTLTLAADTTDKQKGDASFKITGTVTGGFCARAIPVKPGEKYLLSLDLKGSGVTSNGLYLRMNEAASYPATGDHVSITYRASMTDFLSNGPVPSAWNSQQYVYTVPANVYWASIVIIKWTGASAVTVNFDNVEFRRLLPSAGVDLTNATTAVAGLMSSTDKTKLDGVAAGADVTTNAVIDGGTY